MRSSWKRRQETCSFSTLRPARAVATVAQDGLIKCCYYPAGPTVLSLIHVAIGWHHQHLAVSWILHTRQRLAQPQHKDSKTQLSSTPTQVKSLYASSSSVCGQTRRLVTIFPAFLAVEMNCKPIKVDFSTSFCFFSSSAYTCFV